MGRVKLALKIGLGRPSTYELVSSDKIAHIGGGVLIHLLVVSKHENSDVDGA